MRLFVSPMHERGGRGEEEEEEEAAGPGRYFLSWAFVCVFLSLSLSVVGFRMVLSLGT